MPTFHSSLYLVEQLNNKPTKILRTTSKKLSTIQRFVCKTDQIKSEQNSEFQKKTKTKISSKAL